MKRFNVTGLCIPEEHYMCDVTAKFERCKSLVEDGFYYAINFPRQYGKTTMKSLLKREFAKREDYLVVSTSFEGIGDIPFQSEEKLKSSFELLNQLGLGHLKLGQSATSLSGGEAQRLKLAKELIKNKKDTCLPARQECLYLLDEPTTGLHFADIEKLLAVLFNLRDQGHALYIIEHHPWFYKIADHLVELGPVGGNEGGYLVAGNK